MHGDKMMMCDCACILNEIETANPETTGTVLGCETSPKRPVHHQYKSNVVICDWSHQCLISFPYVFKPVHCPRCHIYSHHNSTKLGHCVKCD